MSQREIHKVARLIFEATWAVKGLEYSTRRTSDWRSRDAQRAAEFILLNYEIVPRDVSPRP